MKTSITETKAAVAGNGLVRSFEVQQRCPLQGWNTWVIYDDPRHADDECARLISESASRDKKNWRVIPSTNDKTQQLPETGVQDS